MMWDVGAGLCARPNKEIQDTGYQIKDSRIEKPRTEHRGKYEKNGFI